MYPAFFSFTHLLPSFHGESPRPPHPTTNRCNGRSCPTTKQAQAIRIPAISNSSCAPNWFRPCLPRACRDHYHAVGLHSHAGERLASACRPASSANNRAGPTLIRFLVRAPARLRSSELAGTEEPDHGLIQKNIRTETYSTGTITLTHSYSNTFS